MWLSGKIKFECLKCGKVIEFDSEELDIGLCSFEEREMGIVRIKTLFQK